MTDVPTLPADGVKLTPHPAADQPAADAGVVMTAVFMTVASSIINAIANLTIIVL
jgi:hypothetical protein